MILHIPPCLGQSYYLFHSVWTLSTSLETNGMTVRFKSEFMQNNCVTLLLSEIRGQNIDNNNRLYVLSGYFWKEFMQNNCAALLLGGIRGQNTDNNNRLYVLQVRIYIDF